MSDEQKIDDGGPAFPDADQPAGTGGMSLRDYFAAAAATGLWAFDGHLEGGWGSAKIAKAAYKTADAMIIARRLAAGGKT